LRDKPPSIIIIEVIMIPYTLDIGAIAAAEVTTLRTRFVPRGHMFTCLSVMAWDEDHAIAQSIEIGISGGSDQIPLDATPGNFPVKTSHTLFYPCMLREGQGFYAVFSTPSAGDRLRLVAHGYIEKMEDMR
jgi:hypothetical protein